MIMLPTPTNYAIWPSVVLAAEMLAFEDKWRKVQLNGPDTKGSSLYTGIVNRQI